MSFCCLIALARTPGTIMKRYGKGGQPSLVPDFSGIPLSFFPFSLILAVVAVYCLYYV